MSIEIKEFQNNAVICPLSFEEITNKQHKMKRELGNFAIYETLLGLYKISYKDEKITGIANVKRQELEELEDMNTVKETICSGEDSQTFNRFIYGCRSIITDLAFSQLQEYFKGERFSFDLPLLLIGTDFQIRVWNALCDIPYGETRSYKQVAIAIGKPAACRAVGLANNKNPIAIVVPCHRVIGANGALVGYAGGLEKKKMLLRLEETYK